MTNDPWSTITNKHSPSGLVDRDVEPEYRLGRAINYFYKQNNKKIHEGTWVGICLHAKSEYYPEGYPGRNSLSATLKKPATIITVIAKVPNSPDVMVGVPSKFGNPNELSTPDQDKLEMHRKFRSTLNSAQQIPSPGDIVELDFEDRENFTGGIYLGILEKGTGTMPDRPAEDEIGEAQNAFADAGSSATTVGA